MRTARFGLLVGYSLLIIGFASFFALLRFGPDLGKFGFAFVGSIIVFLCSALALAVFVGSVVCASTSLYCERASRGIGGYVTLFLSVISVFVLGAVYMRGFVVGH